MKIKTLLVDPSLAVHWLDHCNTSNRPLRAGVVESYAADMKAGKWTQCIDPIGFYEDGDLADGQHRLYAIIESETSQTFIIATDLKREDGLNIDMGVPRTVVDNGRISGEDIHLSNNLVAAAKAIEVGDTNGSTNSTRKLSNSEKIALVNKHREAAEFAINHVGNKAKNISNAPVYAAVGRAWYVEKDKDRLADFCSILITGFANGEQDTAAVALRNYLLMNAGIATTSKQWRDTFLKAQNCIKYFMASKPLKRVHLLAEEAYPLKKAKR